MLAAAPKLVTERVRAKLPDVPVDLPAAIKAGARTFADCGGDQAYFGSPSRATAREGRRLLDILAQATEDALQTMS
jgi:creatinine amidohydrolase